MSDKGEYHICHYESYCPMCEVERLTAEVDMYQSREVGIKSEFERLTAGKEKALRHLGECEDELRQANARVEALEQVDNEQPKEK